jgi:radical SAM protein with 4Fe4S-binding SPASM domain
MSTSSKALRPLSISVPDFYDYCAVYLSHRCHLKCTYCITEHNETAFLTSKVDSTRIEVETWAQSLNRLNLPKGIPVTLQGGEPFMYKNLLSLVDALEGDADILTALPPHVNAELFAKMKHPEKLNRDAPYPNIRVSYHPGQNDIHDLIKRIQEIQKIVSIGIYMVEFPESLPELEEVKNLCEQAGVFFKTKEFLGYHEGKLHGEYLFPEAVAGKVTKEKVSCRNSVLIVDVTGDLYKCHSDLYHRRRDLVIGNIFDQNYKTVSDQHRDCYFFGLCSECDVKIKNNHEQVFGYTSVDIKFDS